MPPPDDNLLDIFGFLDVLFIIILIALFLWQFFTWSLGEYSLYYSGYILRI